MKILQMFSGNKKRWETHPSFFCSLCVFSVYTVGTGETYSDALAAFSFLVICETFLLACCLEIVCFAAAFFSSFSAFVLFSAASSRFPESSAASKSFRASFRPFFTLLFCAVFFSITLTLFFADLIFAINFHPTILNSAIEINSHQQVYNTEPQFARTFRILKAISGPDASGRAGIFRVNVIGYRSGGAILVHDGKDFAGKYDIIINNYCLRCF